MLIYQGRSVHNRGSKYWTTDKEWARQFTQSGLDSEIISRKINLKDVFKSNLPQAVNQEEVERMAKQATPKGYEFIEVKKV